MKKIISIVVLFLISICNITFADDPNETSDIIIKSNPKNYHITISATVENSQCNLKTLSVILPYPQSDYYQDINNISINNGELLSVADKPEKYVRFLFDEQTAPKPGEKATCQISFDVTLYKIRTDFKKITELYDYDQNNSIYKLYSSADGRLIVPDNQDILQISDEIWQKSKDILDYAKNCYIYVAKKFTYKNAYTGLHPLEELLANNGGDCGNFSSIYISLLRSKKIPARHLVTVRPDGTYHVRAEFYLEKYGWIPVDVTAKNSNFSGDYFGSVEPIWNGIIVNKDVNLKVQVTNNYQYTLSLLQTYGYWFWRTTVGGNIKVSYKISRASKK
jgi:hypothetical protein